MSLGALKQWLRTSRAARRIGDIVLGHVLRAEHMVFLTAGRRFEAAPKPERPRLSVILLINDRPEQALPCLQALEGANHRDTEVIYVCGAPGRATLRLFADSSKL